MAIAERIMAGWSALTSIILRMCMPGPRQRSAAESGGTAALAVTALTCSWSRVTHLTRAAIGWAVKPLFAYKPGRFGPVNRWTTGRLRIGLVSITAIRILAASARRCLTRLELLLLS